MTGALGPKPYGPMVVIQGNTPINNDVSLAVDHAIRAAGWTNPIDVHITISSRAMAEKHGTVRWTAVFVEGMYVPEEKVFQLSAPLDGITSREDVNSLSNAVASDLRRHVEQEGYVWPADTEQYVAAVDGKVQVQVVARALRYDR
jgi:hypothetical protein